MDRGLDAMGSGGSNPLGKNPIGLTKMYWTLNLFIGKSGIPRSRVPTDLQLMMRRIKCVPQTPARTGIRELNCSVEGTPSRLKCMDTFGRVDSL